MTGLQTFLPKRTSGLIFHAVLLLLILAGIGFFIWMAFRQSGGVQLVLFLAGALILLAILPFIAYRGYALLHAHYDLERDGLHIRWGLRVLDIPINEVEWVRPEEDLLVPLKAPAFSTPGAISGERLHEDLGKIEFIASSMNNLVIVATMYQVVVLSPEDHEEFITRFNRTIEMGSLSPIHAISTKPVIFLRQILSDRAARVMIPLGFGLWFALLVLTSIAIPGISSLSLGYDSSGLLQEPVASSGMLILPIIAALFYLVSLIGGAYSYRSAPNRPVAYILWANGVLTPALLIIAAILFLIWQ